MPAYLPSLDVSVPVHSAGPRVIVRFRVLRDGEVTPSYKRLLVYRGLDSTDRLCEVFDTVDGEFSLGRSIDLAALLVQNEWLIVGGDNAPPRNTRALYMSFSEAGTYTFNIASPADKPEGFGYLAGEFPDGITTHLGTPISATIKVMYTTEDGRMGKVAETVSNPDGTWAVHNLDPTKQFDVICSLAGFNDLILSKVSPTPY